MRKFLLSWIVLFAAVTAVSADNFQVTNANFEDWSGAAFDGQPQAKGWNASNVEQVGMKFNFAHKETGHNGGYCMMVQDQDVGAMGITETSPGYFSIGKPWAYLPSIAEINKATAGTSGGQSWTHRPDTMSVWIRRTGDNWDKEDFYLLYYAWVKEAKGESYKGKNGDCTSHSETNEESDVRILMNGNECKTTTAGEQVCEGMWRERKSYGNWTNIRVPIYYLNDNAPKYMNMIFSASNYPNFRANNGLYKGNSLYVDDVQLIYSSKIQTLKIDGRQWKGFDPNTEEIQSYSLGETATEIPPITAFRGAGQLTNARGATKTFQGRELKGSEIQIVYGDLKNTPTTITVKAEDGSSTTVYRIQFQNAPSSNAKLANISYVYTDKNDKVDTVSIPGFSPTKYNYTVELPYGAKGVPQLIADKQEDAQQFSITQPASQTGKGTIQVTAANGTSKATYNVQFEQGKLADNTLIGIEVDDKSIPGFSPSQTVYKVSLPVGTDHVKVKALSAYPDGEQTIVYTPSNEMSGNLDGVSMQITVTTPGNQVPKTYKLNFKLEASSYSYLSKLEVQGDQIQKCNPAKLEDATQIDFAPDNFTYYINLKMGTSELPAILYERGDDYQTVEISSLGEGVVDGTVRITVKAGNGDQSVYKLVFNTEKSEISTLAGIKIGGEDIPGFRPDSTTYTYALPVGTTELPEIEPIPGDNYQQIVVTKGGVNGKTRITVTAGNGNTTIYQIAFSVATYTDNTLKSLSVEGYDLQNEQGEAVPFDAQVNEYWVKMPQGTTVLPEVHYEAQAAEPMQNIAVRPITSGLNGDYKITVRPQSGASRTYIIHFSVVTSNNVDLTMIYIGGQPIEGFRSDSLHYIDSLPEGVSVVPAVTFDKAEEGQRVLSVLEGKTQIITVTAQDGKTKRTYEVEFIVRASQNAFLNMIYLDGKQLAGFEKTKLDGYEVELNPGAKCPAITVDKEEGQQVTITAPYAAGKAYIKVQPQQGSGNTYTIVFKSIAPQSARLKYIYIDGEVIDDFDPLQNDYSATYSGDLPTVTYKKAYDKQDVQLRWKEDVAWLYVQDTLGYKNVYSIVFTRLSSSDNTLKAIYADGELIKGFAPAQHTYEYELEAGKTYPTVSYEVNEGAQVVFFGQLEAGKWGITVQAEDGTQDTYTVLYTIAKYNDATLKNLAVKDHSFDQTFSPTLFNYTLTIDEGADMPKVITETREGQTVLISNVDDTHQQVIVFAESGANNTYYITYTRKLSDNALLKDILVGGVSLEGFNPAVTHYVDSLDRKNELGQPTSVIPNVFPIGQLANQTITTYYCRPNGEVRILVEAQNGATKEYFIEFPVRKSKNALLGDLYLDGSDASITFNANTFDYEVTLPYESTGCPIIFYEKAEDEQRIDFISRPLGQKSEIIVTAESGDQNTYSILFKRKVIDTKNLLSKVRIVEKDTVLKFENKEQRDFTIHMPYGSRSFTIEYEKSYPEQTVFVQPGGVNNPTIITVKANNGDVADEVYTFTPLVSTQNPAVLESITIDGTPLEGFDKNRFSYVVTSNATSIAAPIVIPKGLNGAVATPTIVNHKHYQVMVSKDGFTNTYDLWYYYTNDVVPNADFTTWTTAANNSAPKPSGWNCLADYFDKFDGPASGTHTFGKHGEVEQVTISGSNQGVKLDSKKSNGNFYSGIYGGALGGILPAWITLGSITGSLQVAAGSKFEADGGIVFRNTPDKMLVRAKTGDVSGKNRIVYKLIGNASKTLEFSTDANTDYKEYSFDLGEANNLVTAPTQLNIILNSFAKEAVGTLTDYNAAEMTVDYVHFTFNHTLSGLRVDTLDAAQEGNAFSVTLKDPERVEIPGLFFTGQVPDQVQQVAWSAPTKGTDYETRTATIRNFAENGTDYTDYTLTVRRPLDTKNQLTDLLVDGTSLTGFIPATTEYTVHIPATSHYLKDVMPVPASSRQDVTTAYNDADSTLTITVTPEKGEATVYTVKFVTDLSDDTTLENINADGVTYEADTREYDIYTTNWPLISYVKRSDRQTVSMINGVLTVTAENGAVGTYIINRHDPIVHSNGVMKEFSLGANVLSDFGGDEIDKNAPKPEEVVFFERLFAADDVVFIQDPMKMQWKVTGTEDSKIYTWTYPTELSTNSYLSAITLGGVDYEKFFKDWGEYDIPSDTTLVVSPVADDEGQTITTSFEQVTGGVLYTIEVAPEDPSAAHRTYTVRVARPLSDVATLAGIELDGVMVEDFDPLVNVYEVTLPVPAVKTAQPKMPNVTYIAGHPGQTITVEPGELNGNKTTFIVQPENGDALLTETYYLTVRAEKSHCSDLTGVTVNGEAVDHFEPGRHYYSVSLATEDILVDYTADDRFLTVEHVVDTVKEHHQLNYTLHVIAEDGTTSDYLIEIYLENQSSDAQLANITLNGLDFVNFERALNPDLTFDPGNNEYKINLPSGTTVWPEVNAQLKMEGQTVEIEQIVDTIFLHVTAVDGVHTNSYKLKFFVPKSTNTELSMIFINGEPLAEFVPSTFFYQVELPVGIHQLPEVAAQKGEVGQTILPINVDEDKHQATIKVLAEEDTYSSTYVVVFQFTMSDVDTLAMIYQDGKPLEGFDPQEKYYPLTLEVGTTAFPELSWQEGDDWQTVKMDTVEMNVNTLIRQIVVTSESKHTRTYTVSYTIEKSDVDTLQMIFVDQKQLADFDAHKTVYYVTLSAAYANELDGAMPSVEYLTGDEYQVVSVLQLPEDSLTSKSLGFKHVINVTAATGKMRTYTIHYPVELSTEATLMMINLSGKPLPNYDAERNNYRLEIAKEASIPVVSVIKKEEAQTYEIQVIEDTVSIYVTAEDVNYQNTYRLTFERLKSANTLLDNIILTDAKGTTFPATEFPFRPEVSNYIVNLQFDNSKSPEAQLPDMEFVFYEEEQTADTAMYHLPNGDIQVDITVTAPNGENQSIYTIIFHFVKASDATLISLSLHGVELQDFRPSKTEYIYSHPYGTDPSYYYTDEHVSYVLSDSLATAEVYMDENGVINVVVTAQNGTTSITYIIEQRTAEDSDNALAWITIDGDTISGFDPEVTFYTYYVFPSDNPEVDAAPRSGNAEVELGRVVVGDTCVILCFAADMSVRRYYVHFALSNVNPGNEAKSGDVLLKRVPGAMQLMASTVRQGVTIALYDQYGHLLMYDRVPVANPNDTKIETDADKQECLLDVMNTRSGLLIDVIPGQPYFYCFFADEKTKLASGKILCY